MDEEEAWRLLDEAGVDFQGGEVHDLVERTEGWPAGLYLAALAVKAGSPRAEAVWSFTGDDRYMGDYLRSEFLNRVSRAEVSFLTRTSVLERMCGPLCDATLNTAARTGCSRTSTGATFWSCPWTVAGIGTAITSCSGSCCTPS